MLHSRVMAVVLGVWAGISSAVPAQTPPEHIEAYVYVVKAEQAERNSRREEALEMYLKSRELYQEVARRYPDWQPELVRYRLVAVQNQIERLQRLAVEHKATAVKSEATNAVSAIAGGADTGADRSKEWEREKEALEMALDDVESERTNLLARVQFLEAALAASKAAVEEALTQEKTGSSELLQQVQDLEAKNKQLAQALEAVRAENQPLVEEIERLQKMMDSAGKDLKAAAEQAARAERKHEEAYAALQQERDALAARVGQLEEQARQSQDMPAMRAQYDRLEEWARSATEAMAGLSNEVARLRAEALSSQEAAAKTQKSEEAERARLMAENQALKISVDELKAESDKVQALKKNIRQLEKDKKEREREIAGLQRALDQVRQNDEVNDLRKKNDVLQEELNVFRLNYLDAEKRIKKLEQELMSRQTGGGSP